MWCTQPIPSPTFPSRPFINVSRLSSATYVSPGNSGGGYGGEEGEGYALLYLLAETPARARGKHRTRKNKKKEQGARAQRVPSRAGEVASTCSLIITYRPVFAVFLTDTQSPRDLAIDVPLSPTHFTFSRHKDPRQTTNLRLDEAEPKRVGFAAISKHVLESHLSLTSAVEGTDPHGHAYLIHCGGLVLNTKKHNISDFSFLLHIERYYGYHTGEHTTFLLTRSSQTESEHPGTEQLAPGLDRCH